MSMSFSSSRPFSSVPCFCILASCRNSRPRTRFELPSNRYISTARCLAVNLTVVRNFRVTRSVPFFLCTSSSDVFVSAAGLCLYLSIHSSSLICPIVVYSWLSSTYILSFNSRLSVSSSSGSSSSFRFLHTCSFPGVSFLFVPLFWSVSLFILSLPGTAKDVSAAPVRFELGPAIFLVVLEGGVVFALF